jgi:hypothetical protein
VLGPSGNKLTIRNGIILTREEAMNFDAYFMEVEDLDRGGMLCRTEMTLLLCFVFLLVISVFQDANQEAFG